MSFHLVCLNWLMWKLLKREILLIGSCLSISTRVITMVNLWLIQPSLLSLHAFGILMVHGGLGGVIPSIGMSLKLVTLVVETSSISWVQGNSLVSLLSDLFFFLADLAVVHLHGCIWVSMNSTTSNTLDSCIWSFGKIVFHLFALEVRLVNHHLVHYHIVAASSLTEVSLLSTLSTTALWNLASLLRNGTTEVRVMVIALITFFLIPNTISVSRDLISITFTCLSVLTSISVGSTSRLSLGLQFTNSVNLVLHIDDWIIWNALIN